MTTFSPSSNSLSDKTLAELKAFFDANGHRPSEAMWTALTELASVLEDMAEGRCEPKMFLSSLDPGVGKTQTVTHFIRALTASEEHPDTGVLICVSRLKEIQRFVDEMDLLPTDFAVLTSDHELNKLGIGSARSNKARVLFTTQQMIESRGEGRHFTEMRDFQFLCRPRQVRIWDESILPGQTVTLNRDALAALLQPIRTAHASLASAISTMYDEIGKVNAAGLYQVPDFAFTFNLDLNGALRVLSRAPRGQVALAHEQAITALWLLSGKTVSVRLDGPYGNTVLDYHETLPEGLSPLVVLDASGRVRETYRQWEENRGGLTRLTPAPKSYKNLTVHCWQTGGGKSAFRENGRPLIDGIVKTINDKPADEEWLIVYHQDGIGMEFKDEVEKRITNKERVHFLNWGSHQATNDYSGVRNVILAGTLFYRPSYYEALARLAADLRPAQGAIGRATLDEVTLGEHRHLVLQALCRGSVRRCQDAECAPCDAYIIAATRSGIPAALPDIFPGCRVIRWQPVQKALSGKVKEAAEFVIDWYKKNPEDLLSFNSVRKAIGMDTQNFRKNVRRHPDFKEALANHGIAEAQELGDNRRGFLRPRFVEALAVE